MKIIGYTGKNKSGLAVVASVHGMGTGLEVLHSEFLKSGGRGGELWLKKYPFHLGLELDDFSRWLENKDVFLAKSGDGAWAIAVDAASVVNFDASGCPLAKGAKKVQWFQD